MGERSHNNPATNVLSVRYLWLIPPSTSRPFGDQVPVTEAMLAVGLASQLEFSTRTAGVEVLLSLAERAPAIMRKCPNLAPGLLPLSLSLACEVMSDASSPVVPWSVRKTSF